MSDICKIILRTTKDDETRQIRSKIVKSITDNLNFFLLIMIGVISEKLPLKCPFPL